MNKPIVAAGVITIAMITMQPSVQAAGLGLNIGFGSFLSHSYHDTAFDETDHALPRWKVLRTLEQNGYHGFHRLRRKGPEYNVRAHRHGRIFKIWVNAYTGHIVKRRRVT